MSRSRLRGALTGAGAAAGSYGVLRARAPSSWQRTNFRGRSVTLAAGPAAAVGTLAGALAGASWPAARAVVLAVVPAAAAGLYDDLAGSRDFRGLRGHLGALRRGEVTTGAVKVVGVGAGALTAAVALHGARPDAVVAAALVAGTANVVNLLDLRPGRAAKAMLLAGVPAAALGAAGADGALGATAALLPADLRERAMLGDTGANALGAALGVGLAARPRPVRMALLVAVVALTLASERVSFSAVIDRTPLLARLDRLGRLP